MKSIDETLKTDPLTELEKATGKSYKELPNDLVLAAALIGNAKKNRDIQAAGELPFGYDIAAGLALFQSLGFRIVHEIPFVATRNHSKPQNERIIFLMHPEHAAIVQFETYTETRTNHASIYFTGRLKDVDAERTSIPMSHGVMVKIVNGVRTPCVTYAHMDMREAPRHWWNRLLETYEFVSPWVQGANGFYLLDYQSWHLPDDEREVIEAARYAELPAEMKTLIGRP